MTFLSTAEWRQRKIFAIVMIVDILFLKFHRRCEFFTISHSTNRGSLFLSIEKIIDHSLWPISLHLHLFAIWFTPFRKRFWLLGLSHRPSRLGSLRLGSCFLLKNLDILSFVLAKSLLHDVFSHFLVIFDRAICYSVSFLKVEVKLAFVLLNSASSKFNLSCFKCLLHDALWCNSGVFSTFSLFEQFLREHIALPNLLVTSYLEVRLLLNLSSLNVRMSSWPSLRLSFLNVL